MDMNDGLKFGDLVCLKDGAFPDLKGRCWIVKAILPDGSILLRGNHYKWVRGVAFVASPEHLIKIEAPAQDEASP